MKYAKIAESAETVKECGYGLKALKELLPLLENAPMDSVHHVTPWMRIIIQNGKRTISQVDSEVHRKYHDIFYLSQGREMSIFQGAHTMEDALELYGNPDLHEVGFNEGKDIGFVSLDKTGVWNVIDSEHYVHYAPGEFHCSQLQMDDEPIRKYVVKIMDKSFWEEGWSEETLKEDIQTLKNSL